MHAADFGLPETERAVAAVLGRVRALEISGIVCERLSPPSRQRGAQRGRGGDLYVPSRLDLRESYTIVDLLGREDAEKLIDVFAGETLHFGMCHQRTLRERNELMRKMRDEGCLNRDIASTFKVTERTVRNVFRGEGSWARARRTRSPEVGSAVRSSFAKFDMFIRTGRVPPNPHETFRSYFERCARYATGLGRT